MRLLDTNICSYLLRRSPERVLAEYAKQPAGSLAISEVTLAELRYGAEHSPQKAAALLSAIDALLLGVKVLPWAAAKEYGTLRCQLEVMGRPMGHMDLMLAAHAMSVGAILVTNDRSDFIHVPGLRLENWV